MRGVISQSGFYIRSPSGSVGNDVEVPQTAVNGPRWSPFVVRPLQTKALPPSKIPRLETGKNRNQPHAIATLEDLERLLQSGLEGSQRAIEVIRVPRQAPFVC